MRGGGGTGARSCAACMLAAVACMHARHRQHASRCPWRMHGAKHARSARPAAVRAPCRPPAAAPWQVGDVLLAASFVSYAGPFNSPLRGQLVEQAWRPDLLARAIPITSGVSPLALLADDAARARWGNEGLPTDPLSIENGAIITSAARWPLMIDPQLQVRCCDGGGGGRGCFLHACLLCLLACACALGLAACNHRRRTMHSQASTMHSQCACPVCLPACRASSGSSSASLAAAWWCCSRARRATLRSCLRRSRPACRCCWRACHSSWTRCWRRCWAR